jgi:hypothetical protein
LRRSLSPARPQWAGQPYRRMPSHVPHESRRPVSRHLYAGHRLASKRAPARLIPGQKVIPGFDAIFINNDASPVIPGIPGTALRLTGPYLTPQGRLFHSRSPRSRHRSRSMWQFEAAPRREAPKGRQSFISRTAPHSATRLPQAASVFVAHLFSGTHFPF